MNEIEKDALVETIRHLLPVPGGEPGIIQHRKTCPTISQLYRLGSLGNLGGKAVSMRSSYTQAMLVPLSSKSTANRNSRNRHHGD